MLSMKTRLECPRSYATDESPDLLCEVGKQVYTYWQMAESEVSNG